MHSQAPSPAPPVTPFVMSPVLPSTSQYTIYYHHEVTIYRSHLHFSATQQSVDRPRWLHTLKKLAPERNLHENWRKFVTVFLHNNSWPANHIAPFVLRTGEFLSCDRAMLNCVQETCRPTGTKLVQDWPAYVQVFCSRRHAHVSGRPTTFLSVCRWHSWLRKALDCELSQNSEVIGVARSPEGGEVREMGVCYSLPQSEISPQLLF